MKNIGDGIKNLQKKDGLSVTIQSGIPKVGDEVILIQGTDGRYAAHKSGIPSIGDEIALLQDKNGIPVAIKSGGENTEVNWLKVPLSHKYVNVTNSFIDRVRNQILIFGIHFTATKSAYPYVTENGIGGFQLDIYDTHILCPYCDPLIPHAFVFRYDLKLQNQLGYDEWLLYDPALGWELDTIQHDKLTYYFNTGYVQERGSYDGTGKYQPGALNREIRETRGTVSAIYHSQHITRIDLPDYYVDTVDDFYLHSENGMRATYGGKYILILSPGEHYGKFCKICEAHVIPVVINSSTGAYYNDRGLFVNGILEGLNTVSFIIVGINENRRYVDGELIHPVKPWYGKCMVASPGGIIVKVNFSSENIGFILEITEGTGSGQKRRIIGTDENEVFVEKDWDLVPDITSKYQIKSKEINGETIYPIGSPSGGCVSATTNSIITDPDAPDYNSEMYSGFQIEIYEGAGKDQIRKITKYEKGTFTINENWITVPDKTSKYRILPKIDCVFSVVKKTWAGKTYGTYAYDKEILTKFEARLCYNTLSNVIHEESIPISQSQTPRYLDHFDCSGILFTTDLKTKNYNSAINLDCLAVIFTKASFESGSAVIHYAEQSSPFTTPNNPTILATGDISWGIVRLNPGILFDKDNNPIFSAIFNHYSIGKTFTKYMPYPTVWWKNGHSELYWAQLANRSGFIENALLTQISEKECVYLFDNEYGGLFNGIINMNTSTVFRIEYDHHDSCTSVFGAGIISKTPATTPAFVLITNTETHKMELYEVTKIDPVPPTFQQLAWVFIGDDSIIGKLFGTQYLTPIGYHPIKLKNDMVSNNCITGGTGNIIMSFFY